MEGPVIAEGGGKRVEGGGLRRAGSARGRGADEKRCGDVRRETLVGRYTCTIFQYTFREYPTRSGYPAASRQVT
eukprot:1429069-Pyramimonas_sp.AAC.1